MRQRQQMGVSGLKMRPRQQMGVSELKALQKTEVRRGKRSQKGCRPAAQQIRSQRTVRLRLRAGSRQRPLRGTASKIRSCPSIHLRRQVSRRQR